MADTDITVKEVSPFRAEHEAVQQYRNYSYRNAVPPSIEAKKRASQLDQTSTDHPLHPTPEALNRRTTVDEVFVGPSNSNRTPPCHVSHVESAEIEEGSIVGTVIELEMSSSESHEAPLFRRMIFGERVKVPERATQPSAKRRASQRMSITLESVRGFGRELKRRVSSLWSKEERKDSAWVEPETAVGCADNEGTGEVTPHPTPDETNPYPSRANFLEGRARQDRSSRASSHWTPVASSARSVADGESCLRTWANSSPNSSLSKRPLLSDWRLNHGDSEDQGAVIGSKTPTSVRPQGSLMGSRYSLAQHLEQAIESGRFDTERIEQRFYTCENLLESASSTAAANVDNAHGQASQEEGSFNAEESVAAQTNSSNRDPFMRIGHHRPTQASEQRSSVAGIQEPEASFGEELAQIAGVIGKSMQQGVFM